MAFLIRQRKYDARAMKVVEEPCDDNLKNHFLVHPTSAKAKIKILDINDCVQDNCYNTIEHILNPSTHYVAL